MFVKNFVVTIIFSIDILRGVSGASYSNVYVERDIVPRGYYRYGAPYTSSADPRISQITSLPAITEYGAPCVSPCVFPAQAVSPVVAPVNPSPNVLTYSAPIPSVPVLVTPAKEAANGYEYSYAVYDESTGDHKAQRELSDGSVVRGEYSFIQPDGYVREVQYVADDISGFNAVVKNFLPATLEGKKKVESVKTESSPPLTFDCHEIKSESFKQGSNGNAEEITGKYLLKIHENLHKEPSKEESAENSKEMHNEEEESKASSNEKLSHSSEENSKEGKQIKQKHAKEESVEETEDKSKEVHGMKPEHSIEQSSEGSQDKSKEPKHSTEESDKNSKEDNSHSKESEGKSQENQQSKSKSSSNEPGEESISKESKEELKEKSKKKATKHSGEESSEKDKTKSKKELSEEDSSEKLNQRKHKETFELLKPPQEAVVPYHDIVRCIQAAMRRSYGVPSAVNEDHSPLTYIVLNKPC